MEITQKTISKSRKYLFLIIPLFIFINLFWSSETKGVNLNLQLFEGWNIISSPAENPLTISQIEEYCVAGVYRGHKFWSYDPKEFEWSHPAQVKNDEGVYIYVFDDCRVGLEGNPAQFSSKSLYIGWNLFSTETSFKEIKGDCEIISDPPLWKYNPETERWERPSLDAKLDQSKGYWVAVEDDCTLSVSEEECTKGSDCPTGDYCRESDQTCQSLPECKLRNDNSFGYTNAPNGTSCSGTPGKCCSGACDNDGITSHSDYHQDCRSGPSCIASGDWGYSSTHEGSVCGSAGGHCENGYCAGEGCTKGSECNANYYCRQSDHTCQAVPVCQLRVETGYGTTNIANNTQISGCNSTCQACQSGSCGVANAGTDPGNVNCGTTGCLTGNCKGGVAQCDYYVSGQHNCNACYECNTSGVCTVVADSTSCSGTPGKCCSGACDNDGITSHSDYHQDCRSGPSCIASGDWGYSPDNEGLACGDRGGHCEAGYCAEEENHPPVAEAGDPKEVDETQSVILDGSGFDEDGDPMTFSWICDGGTVSPSSGSVSLSGNATTTYTAPEVDADTIYTCRLTIIDDKETSDSDLVVLTVKNLVKPVENKKDSTKYSSKEVFLISDSDWKNVLPLVPVAIWTDKEGAIHKYPTLIYHKENSGFDADSILYFLEQYNAQKLTAVNNLPSELTGLINSQGLTPEIITADDYFSFWEEFKDIVYVEANYEKSLLASTYASLINAPLIIKGTSADDENTFQGREAILVGSVSCPSGATCKEKYSLEQLQQKYVEETNTDKIILVNPNDLSIKVTENFSPEKSSGSISELYSKTSLAAPILASGKQELIISIASTNYQTVDSFIENKISSLGINAEYLTIVASPDAIQASLKLEELDYAYSLDGYKYADIDDDPFIELAPGRIFGITLSDVSSYVNRSVFYDSIASSVRNILLIGKDFGSMEVESWMLDKILSASGYTTKTFVGYPTASGNDWLEKQYISYNDHGSTDWAGIHYSDIPYLDNSFVTAMACLTCAFDVSLDPSHPYGGAGARKLFCAHALRKGAMGYIGAVDYGTELSNKDFIFYIFGSKKTVGEANKDRINMDIAYMAPLVGIITSAPFGNQMLLGDPTIQPKIPNYELPKTKINKIDDLTYEIIAKNRYFLLEDSAKDVISTLAQRGVYASGLDVPASMFQIKLPLSSNIKNVKNVLIEKNSLEPLTSVSGKDFVYLLDENKDNNFLNISILAQKFKENAVEYDNLWHNMKIKISIFQE